MSERIETKFRYIIRNHSHLLLTRFPRVSYSYVVRRRIHARINLTPLELSNHIKEPFRHISDQAAYVMSHLHLSNKELEDGLDT